MAVTKTDLDALRKEAKKLENEIDGKLIAFGKIHHTDDSAATDDLSTPLLSEETVFSSLVDEIDRALAKLKVLNEEMLELPFINITVQHTIQRHGELYKELKKEFEVKLAQNNLRREKEQLFHLQSRNSNKSQSTSAGAPSGTTLLYLKENQHLEQSHNLVNEQISIAVETRESLQMQRDTLKRLKTRFIDITNRFPVLNNLIYRINFKRRKDSLIVGFIIALCTFLLLYLMFF